MLQYYNPLVKYVQFYEEEIKYSLSYKKKNVILL